MALTKFFVVKTRLSRIMALVSLVQRLNIGAPARFIRALRW
jgi:hypothetical protein